MHRVPWIIMLISLGAVCFAEVPKTEYDAIARTIDSFTRDGTKVNLVIHVEAAVSGTPDDPAKGTPEALVVEERSRLDSIIVERFKDCGNFSLCDGEGFESLVGRSRPAKGAMPDSAIAACGKEAGASYVLWVRVSALYGEKGKSRIRESKAKLVFTGSGAVVAVDATYAVDSPSRARAVFVNGVRIQ
jgi:hypothetical protein